MTPIKIVSSPSTRFLHYGNQIFPVLPIARWQWQKHSPKTILLIQNVLNLEVQKSEQFTWMSIMNDLFETSCVMVLRWRLWCCYKSQNVPCTYLIVLNKSYVFCFKDETPNLVRQMRLRLHEILWNHIPSSRPRTDSWISAEHVHLLIWTFICIVNEQNI